MLTPRLSSYWVHWMTPIPAGIARPLIEGLRNEVVVRDDTARQIFPAIHPLDFPTAVRNALAQLEAGPVETTWSDALVTTEGDHAAVVLTLREGMIVERRQETLNAPAESSLCGLLAAGRRDAAGCTPPGCGGCAARSTGWPAALGMRRGRRDPVDVRVGDALDFWRVEAVEPGRLLRLRAEMKVPGRAWLQFEALPREPSGSRLIQTAFFAPRGLLGLLYWYGLYPVHALDLLRPCPAAGGASRDPHGAFRLTPARAAKDP